ncbi:transposon Ty3-I Gag-Pol polyprotein [Trichonephila inaurata madagascariensis]|uniref:Transposon Ty3-I Gag-Pol polyprotein n=1 Tax=Trichonephila inaurata madagascariensis TaxID=2747483 RepID=A0A8X6XAN1_9ARAC|nr:transposon Ty3-I Gag-Pol polyprotein [Trichonephila inaurata madagascariensis]
MCLCYLDNNIIFSETFDGHLQRLRSVLKCIQDTCLVLNPKKCVFGSRQIEISEHLVSEEDIMPDPRKVRAVQNFPVPKNIRDLPHGRKAKTTLETMFPYSADGSDDDYVSRLITRAEESRQLARIRTLEALHRDKIRYDAS